MNEEEEGFIPKRRARGRMSTIVVLLMMIAAAVGAFWLGLRGREQVQLMIVGPEPTPVTGQPSAPTGPNGLELN